MKTLSIFHHPIIRIIPIGLLAKYYELFTLKSNYFTIYKTPAFEGNLLRRDIFNYKIVQYIDRQAVHLRPETALIHRRCLFQHGCDLPALLQMRFRKNSIH